MVYSELLFFLGVLPVSVLLSFLDRSAEYKNLILIITSAAFISWGKPMWCLLILTSTVSEYLIGLGIGRLRTNSRPAAAGLLALSGIINLGLLVLFAHNSVFPEGSVFRLRDAVIPMGAAWYSAKAFSYSFDVFTGRCRAERNYFCLLTYMSSYHFVMAGPVVRYGDMEPMIRSRRITGAMLSNGLDRFIIGLAKYVILAPAFSRLAAAGLEHRDATLAGSWIGMLAYLGECWFTFTALCDMAKGLGLLNGFDYEENYRDLSVSNMLTGFVTSANTTLIRLFRDFFGMFTRGNDFFAAVFTLAGCVMIALWYSISYPFLAVGIALGAVLMIERLIPEKTKKRIPAAVKAVYVFLLAVLIVGGIRFTDLEGYKSWLLSLFGSGNEYILTKALKKVLLENLFLIVIGFCCVCVPVKSLLKKGIGRLEERSVQCMGIVRIGRTVLLAVLLVMCVITLAAQRVG